VQIKEADQLQVSLKELRQQSRDFTFVRRLIGLDETPDAIADCRMSPQGLL
jgi:hypothetical protein